MKQIPWTFTFPFDDGTSKSVTGYTPLPEKGVDYNTPADQESIVQQVIAALGTPVFGMVDADNNIILTGKLGDGTYTVKYEDAEGNVVVVGTIDQGGPSTFNVPITWIIGTKLSKTTGAVEATDDANYNASDFIQLVEGASYVVSTTTDVYNSMNVVYYNAAGTFVGYQDTLWEANKSVDEPSEGNAQSVALVIPDGATQIRLRQWEQWRTQGGSHQYITMTGTIAEGGSSYTNQIPISTDLSGNALANGVLYDGQRWNSSGGQTALEGYFVSGLIPVKVGDLVRIRWPGGGDANSLQVKAFLADRSAYSGYLPFALAGDPDNVANGSILAALPGYQYSLENGILDFTMAECSKFPANVAYITVTLYGTPADCIVTVNEPIG